MESEGGSSQRKRANGNRDEKNPSRNEIITDYNFEKPEMEGSWVFGVQKSLCRKGGWKKKGFLGTIS